MNRALMDPSPAREKSTGRGSWVPTVAVGLCFGIGTGVLGLHLLRSRLVRLIPSVKVTAQSAPGAQPPNSKGPGSAAVVLEEFSDFQCPPCKALSEKLKRIEGEYGSQIKIVYRQYPLASHKNALAAALAAEAAGLQGHFWEMHDLLFQNQKTWESSNDPQLLFDGYARSLGLDMARFKADVSGQQASRRVRADQERGDSIGVPGTPVVLINGVQVPPTAITDSGLKGALEKDLKDRGCSDGCTQ